MSTPTKKQYKDIFFDLDHTIWDFDTNAKLSVFEMFDELQLEKIVEVDAETFYPVYLENNHLLWARYEQGFISSSDLKWKRMWRTLLHFKKPDEVLSKTMSEKFLEILPIQKTLFPHTFEILDYLKAKEYNLHLITNGFEVTQKLKLQHSGLAPYFIEMITSERSQSMKPKKEIFEYALNATDAKLETSIMIGDNLKADIQGAINAGMDNVFMNHINETVKDIVPMHAITHLKELETIL